MKIIHLRADKRTRSAVEKTCKRMSLLCPSDSQTDKRRKWKHFGTGLSRPRDHLRIAWLSNFSLFHSTIVPFAPKNAITSKTKFRIYVKIIHFINSSISSKLVFARIPITQPALIQVLKPWTPFQPTFSQSVSLPASHSFKHFSFLCSMKWTDHMNYLLLLKWLVFCD